LLAALAQGNHKTSELQTIPCIYDIFMTFAGIRDFLRAFSGAMASPALKVFRLPLENGWFVGSARKKTKPLCTIVHRGSDSSDLPGQGR
jgi:hypothetical protein